MEIITKLLPPILVVLGSIGMILFASKFPFTTAIWELKHTKERVLFLNGYYVWVLSWFFIIAGALIQLWNAAANMCQ